MMKREKSRILPIAALQGKNRDKFPLASRAGKAERFEMAAAVLVDYICDRKMQQIPVLMEPGTAHLLHI
ncbi:hypothetical protein D3C86_2111260 [compost metagenome]